MPEITKPKVGNLRPTQLMFTYGVGAIVDLPKISVIVNGLEDWPTNPAYSHPIMEDRLLQVVRYHLPDVKRLLSPPITYDTGRRSDPFDETSKIGVPVATFPRWMVCPECRLLAPLDSGLFKIKTNPYYPERTAYVHETCNKTRPGKAPDVIPARFMVACENGHLDDFPWVKFIHQGAPQPCEHPILRLLELGPSGEARDLILHCSTCNRRRPMSQAFGHKNREKMPDCRGRRPHLRDYDQEECGQKMRAIVLGASNSWFPVIQSTIAIPVETDKFAQLVTDLWAKLQFMTSIDVLKYSRATGDLGGELSKFKDKEIWEAIEAKRKQDAEEIPPPDEQPDLKYPEWQVLTNPSPALNTSDFRLRVVAAPPRFSSLIQQVVLVERLREVLALIGFTRIDSYGEFTDPDMQVEIPRAPLSRTAPTWVPANEVRGEGIFLQINEARLLDWVNQRVVKERADEFFESHKRWREARFIENVEEGFPGMRYVLLHSFSHALMRQFALECGYSAASIRERIYCRQASDSAEVMAGILIYTAAPDSEGTLGGLVSLAETETLERHIIQALEVAKLCASDPLCAEHPPSQTGRTIHAAACHACLFAPETACERGNKYLDRSTLIETVERSDLAYFE